MLQPGRQYIFGNGLREQGVEAEVISVLLQSVVVSDLRGTTGISKLVGEKDMLGSSSWSASRQ